MKINGQRVELGEVEARLYESDLVASALVEHRDGLVAFVAPPQKLKHLVRAPRQHILSKKSSSG